jgi:hypothetical protein
LGGLVDVAGDDGLAVGGLVALGLLALAGVAGPAQLQGGAVGIELLEGLGGGQQAGLVEGLLDALLRRE